MEDNTVTPLHYRAGAAASRPGRKLVSLLLMLVLLAGCVAPAENSAGGAPQSGGAPVQNSSPGCSDVQPGRLCLLSGSIRLDTLDEENLALSQPGEQIDLATLRAVRLGTDGAGSVAVLTIQAAAPPGDTPAAPGATPETPLTLLAFGDVSLTNQAAGDPDRRAFSSLTFHSEGASSGLLIVSLGGEKYGSLLVNGAFLTLGSSALVQTQAGQMTMATLEGAVTVDAELATQAAPAGAQVAVPLDEAGFAAGEPAAAPADSVLVQNVAQAVNEYLNGSRSTDTTDPKVQAVMDAVDAYLQDNNGSSGSGAADPLVQAVNDAVSRYLEELKHKQQSGQAESAPSVYDAEISDTYKITIAVQAIEMVDYLSRQCTQVKNPRQVYRMIKWNEYIRTFAADGIHIGAEKMKKIDAQVAGCVHFELVFDSTIQTQTGEIGMDSHVHAQGIEVKYDPKTGKLTGASGPLEYQSFSVIEPADESCKRTESKQNGTIEVTGGQMQVAGKQVQIELQIAPEMPSEELVYSCDDGNGNWISSPPIPTGHWQNFFRQLFSDLASGASGGFTIKDWKYTGAPSLPRPSTPTGTNPGKTLLQAATPSCSWSTIRNEITHRLRSSTWPAGAADLCLHLPLPR